MTHALAGSDAALALVEGSHALDEVLQRGQEALEGVDVRRLDGSRHALLDGTGQLLGDRRGQALERRAVGHRLEGVGQGVGADQLLAGGHLDVEVALVRHGLADDGVGLDLQLVHGGVEGSLVVAELLQEVLELGVGQDAPAVLVVGHGAALEGSLRFALGCDDLLVHVVGTGEAGDDHTGGTVDGVVVGSGALARGLVGAGEAEGGGGDTGENARFSDGGLNIHRDAFR